MKKSKKIVNKKRHLHHWQYYRSTIGKGSIWKVCTKCDEKIKVVLDEDPIRLNWKKIAENEAERLSNMLLISVPALAEIEYSSRPGRSINLEWINTTVRRALDQLQAMEDEK